MFFDSIQITEGGNISNLVVASGTQFPAEVSTGELYFHTGENKLYAFNGSVWTAFTSDISQIPESQINDDGVLARLADNENVNGSWTFTNTVTGVDPTAAQHLATKAYVDTIASGLKPKAAVRVATTTNISLAGSQVIDGILAAENDRVLVKNQVSWNQNGVWVVTASGPWTRAHDFDNSPDSIVASGDFFYVQYGSQGGTAWVLLTQDPVVGVTGMEFSQVISAANGVTYIQGSGGTTGLTVNGGPITTAGTLTLGGTLNISNGGTGATTATGAINALLPAQTSNGGKVLTTDGTNTSWTTVVTNGDITIGTTAISLGGSSSTLAGLTSVASTSFVGALTGHASSASVADTATTATTATNLAGGSTSSIPYQTAAGQTAMLPFGAAGYVLTSNGSNAPSWQAAAFASVDASLITGTTIAANVVNSSLTSVGTLTSLDVTGVISASSIGAAVNTALTIQSGNGSAPGHSGQDLTLLGGNGGGTYSNGGSVLIKSKPGSTLYGNIDGHITLTAEGNGSTGGAYISIAPSSVETVRFISGGAWSLGSSGTNTGTAGQVLSSTGGTSAPQWITLGSTSTNLAGGSAGSLPYQSAAGTTAMLAAGSAGQVLTSNGAAAPSWQAGVSASSVNTWTAANRGAVNTLTFGSTVTPDFAVANNFALTVTSNFTLAFPSNVAPGQSGIIVISQDAVGSRVVTWGNGWVAAGGSKPALTTTANAVDYISYYAESSSRIFVSIIADVK